MRKFLKWTLWIVAFLLIVFFGVIVAGTKYAKRAAPWPDPVPGISLTPSRPFLSASNIGPDNAYFYFLQLTNVWVDLSEEARDEMAAVRKNGWTAGASTNLEAWISTNRAAFDLLASAAQLTNSQAPTVESFNTVMREITPFVMLQRVQAFETSRAFEEGRADAAVSNIEVALRCAANIEPGQGVFGRLIASASDAQALYQVRLGAQNGHLDRNANEKISDLINWRMAHREPLSEGIKFDAIPALNAVGMIYDQGVKAALGGSGVTDRSGILLPLLGSSRDRTRQHLAASWSHLIQASGDLTRARKADAALVAFLDPPSKIVRYFDDPIGRMMAALVLPAVGKFTESNFWDEAKFHAAVAMLAVERWRMDHGDVPPAALGDLVPQYLAKIPEDPIAKGSNLLYRVDAEAYVVYSVGANGADNHGDVETSNSSDVGWRVELDRKAGAK